MTDDQGRVPDSQPTPGQSPPDAEDAPELPPAASEPSPTAMPAVPEPPLAPPSPQMADPLVPLPDPTPPVAVSPAVPPAAPPPGPSYTWDQPVEPAGPAPGVSFAGHGGRLVAYIIDAVILTVISLAVLVIAFIFLGIGASTDSEGTTTVGTGSVLAFVVGLLIILVVTIAYFPFFWARSGATPGMSVFKLRVVRDVDGGAITWGTAIVRYLVFIVLTSVGILGLIGFGWILVDARRRGWHDLVAGTCVIQRA